MRSSASFVRAVAKKSKNRNFPNAGCGELGKESLYCVDTVCVALFTPPSGVLNNECSTADLLCGAATWTTNASAILPLLGIKVPQALLE